MTITEIVFILAMLNICIVSFIWIMKQVFQLCYWICKREIEKEIDNG